MSNIGPTGTELTQSYYVTEDASNNLNFFSRVTGNQILRIDKSGNVIPLAGITPAGNLNPSADSADTLGTSTLRWLSAASVEWDAYHAVTDANPSAQVTDGVLKLGPGGASALDTTIGRDAARVIQVFNGTNPGGISLSGTAGDGLTSGIVGGRGAALQLVSNCDGTTARNLQLKTPTSTAAGTGAEGIRLDCGTGAALGSVGIKSNEQVYFASNTTGFAYAAQAGIGADASAGNLILNAPTGKYIDEQVNGVSAFRIANTGVTSYANDATAGIGIQYAKGSSLQASISAAATVLTVTPAATSAVYEINVVADCSAATSATGFGFTIDYHDSNGQVKTGIAIPIALSTSPATFATTVTLTANAEVQGSALISIDNSASNIVIKTVFGGTSFTAKCSEIVARLA